MKRRVHRKPPVFFAGMFFLLLAVLSSAWLWWVNYEPVTVLPPSPAVLIGGEAGRREAGLQLSSRNALLFDPATGEVIYAKGALDRVFPASLTKVMTALVSLEGIESLDAPVTLLYEDFKGLYEQNAAMAGFAMGETVTARDLLYATLLPSGAEAARALARTGCGSVEEAVLRMNQKAAELNMTETRFVNVSGLHDDAHYTTLSDFALLWREAIKNEALLAAMGELRYTTTPTEQHPQGLRCVSTMLPRLAVLGRDKLDPLLGGKTGYTKEAGFCLVSLAEQGGVQRALVTVGAQEVEDASGKKLPYNLIDAYTLYERSLPSLVN